jgi:hypothetical protein
MASLRQTVLGGEGWQLTMNVGYSMTSVEWYGESLGSCRMGVVTGKTEARLQGGTLTPSQPHPLGSRKRAKVEFITNGQ